MAVIQKNRSIQDYAMTNVSAQDDQFIQKLNELIEANMTNSQFGVLQLAREMHMSRSNLHRKVREITGKTVVSLISEARLKRALELLKEGTLTVSEVAYESGFGSPTYFDKCFHDHYGFPPGEARNRNLAEIQVGQARQVTAGNLKKRNIILTAVLSLIILAVVIFIFILLKPFSGDHKEIEKSIAVLPFINDSPDTANVYFINGIMEGIINNLSKIKDLHVLSRTSVEQYRNNKTKTIPQIAKELGVKYIVEGSGQKYSDQVMLSIQLIETGSDKHLLSEQYKRNWEDIFNLQSEIATLVANSINAVITPEEAELVEEKPTDNITAYNLYLRGIELFRIGATANDTNLERQAEFFFKKAIQLDSAFSYAYMYLGWSTYIRNVYDSALYYANLALHFNDKNSDAYRLKGSIFLWHSGEDKSKEAEDAFRLAIKYNPNSSEGYNGLGDLYWKNGDYPQWIEYKLKSLKLERDPFKRYVILTFFCPWLNHSGFYEEALIFTEEIIKYNNDSLHYYWGKIGQQMTLGNYDSAYKIAQTAAKSKKWADFNPYTLANICMFNRDYPEALKHVEDYIQTQEKQGAKVNPDGMIGFIYLKNGQKEKSDYHFDGYISNQLKMIKENQPHPSVWNYINLTWLYSAMNDKEKALENLRKAAKCEDPEALKFAQSYLIYKNCNPPIYETVRDEPEFQEYFQHIEDRLRPEREKIKKLFREAGLYD